MKQNEKGTPKGTLKRGFAALLTSCMCVSMVPADAFAAELQQEGYKALDMQLDAEGDIKAEKVNYSLAANTTVYLAKGQKGTLKLYSGADAIKASDWVTKKVVDGEETDTDEATAANASTGTDGEVTITHGTDKTSIGNVYHVYPQVKIGGKNTNAKDANGNDLYYTVVYLGKVKVIAPDDTEVKVGTTPKFKVETAYADADAELKKLVSENATLTYNGTGDDVDSDNVKVDPKTGKITLLPGKKITSGKKVTVTAKCGDANKSVSYGVVAAADPKVASIKLDKTTVELGKTGTATVNADVLASTGKEAYNYQLDGTAANVKSSDENVATATVTPADAPNKGNKIEIEAVAEGTATITVQSLANPNKTATITVNVEPYLFENKVNTFNVEAGAATATDVKEGIHYEEEVSAGFTVEYKAEVTAAYDANGKAVADKDKVLTIATPTTTGPATAVKGGNQDGYAILKVTATAKSETDPSVSYKHAIEFKVYNVTDTKKAKAVVFSKLNDKKKEVVDKPTAGNQDSYVVGDKFKLTAYGVDSDTINDDDPIYAYTYTDAGLKKAEMSGVTWSVEPAADAKKVSVDENGNVEILAACADTKIRATSISNPDKYAEYTITTATDLSKNVKLETDLVNTSSKEIVEATDGKEVTFTVNADVVELATYDWSVSNSQYATLEPEKYDAKTGNAEKGEQKGKAKLKTDKVISAVEPVTVTVTMTSRKTPSVKETKTKTIYIVPEGYEAADIVEVTAADGTEVKDTVGLGTGDTYALKATVKGAEKGGVRKDATVQDVKWESSDESIATVDANGVVTAVAASEETVDIIATAAAKKADGTSITEVVTFSVSDIAVEAIETAESVSVEAGSTKTVDVLLTNKDGSKKATNQAVTVASDNEAVATAKAANGTITVTGVAAGTANIVVTSEENKEVTATIPVTVTAAPVAPVEPTNPTEVAVSAITLSQSSALLSAGKTVALAATVAPENATNKAVTWTSSDASVATVDANGVVTAVSAGKATITATAGTVSATCDVTVSSVKLNAKTVPLQVKKSTSALKATVSAKEDAVVSWKSSNTKVVKVNAKTGKLTATSKTGTAKITVTTKSGAKATCTVKVQKARVTTKSIAFAKKSVSLKKGKSVKLTIKRNPISATEKITWTSSNKKVATVDKNGKVTGKKAGKATITAKTSNGKKATCKVTVK